MRRHPTLKSNIGVHPGKPSPQTPWVRLGNAFAFFMGVWVVIFSGPFPLGSTLCPFPLFHRGIWPKIFWGYFPVPGIQNMRRHPILESNIGVHVGIPRRILPGSSRAPPGLPQGSFRVLPGTPIHPSCSPVWKSVFHRGMVSNFFWVVPPSFLHMRKKDYAATPNIGIDIGMHP